MKLKKQQQTGMVLVTILIFLTVISLLVGMNMQTGQLQLHMSRNSLLKEKSFKVAQEGLYNIFSTIKKSGGHIGFRINPHSRYCTSWQLQRESTGCLDYAGTGSVENANYWYLIDKITPPDPTKTIDCKHAVSFYRVTLIAKEKSFSAAKAIVQAFVAVSDLHVMANKKAKYVEAFWSWCRL